MSQGRRCCLAGRCHLTRVTAARLIQHGQPLQIQEVELAEPGEDEVILDVAYSGVNPIDIRRGRNKPRRTPRCRGPSAPREPGRPTGAP